MSSAPHAAVVVVMVISCLACAEERHFRLPENSPVGTSISNLKRDFDVPASVVPFFVPTAPSLDYDSYFDFDTASGVFKTSRPLDRESLCGPPRPRDPCNFTFVMHGASDMHKVTVEVTDVNDNPPKFARRSLRLSMPESDFVGMTYDLCSVTDEDLAMNSLLKIKSQTKSDYFEVLSASKGQGSLDLTLQLNKKLDREEQKVHQLLVTVEDGGDPSLSSHLPIEVHVMDVNDNPPVFENNGKFIVRIPENARIGTVVTTLNATDRDEGPNGRIMYEVVNTDQTTRETFIVGTMTGEIGLYRRLDFETVRRYEMKVVASDMGRPSLSATATVVFEVLDVNDNPPVVSLTYLSSKGHGEVIENRFLTSRGRNESLIAVVTATDEDHSEENNVVACTCADDRFTVVRHSRFSQLLTTHHLFDREREPWLNFKMTCRDNGQPSLGVSESIQIKVLDVNDNAPSFDQSRYMVTVDENLPPGEIVIQVFASDADEGDNGSVVYGIEGDGHLTIDRDTGVVSIATPYDRENSGEHVYEIVARDRGIPRVLSSTSTLVVSVSDVDEAPAFAKNTHLFRLVENQPPMTEIGRLEATDPDLSEKFRGHDYVIERQEANHFAIDRNGTLYSLVPLDREVASSHNLCVCVRSTNNKRLQSCLEVMIMIEDQNDNVPRFVQPQTCTQQVTRTSNEQIRATEISKFLPVGSEVIKFAAEDLDLSPGDATGGKQTFHFRMVEAHPGISRDVLHLDESSGKLSVSGHLSEFPSNSMEIVVQVSEANMQEHNSRCVFMIELTNETTSPGHVSSLTSSEKNDFMLISAVSASAGVALILVVAMVTVICKIRRRRRRRRSNAKGRPVRPDLIQNGRKSSEVVHFRDVQMAESYTLPSSTLTLDVGGYNYLLTFPTLSTFAKDPVVGIPGQESNVISCLPSDASSRCSSTREEMLSLMHQATHEAPTIFSKAGGPPIYNPDRHVSDVFPLSFGHSLQMSHSRHSRNVHTPVETQVKKSEEGVESIQSGNYIRYNDLY